MSAMACQLGLAELQVEKRYSFPPTVLKAYAEGRAKA